MKEFPRLVHLSAGELLREEMATGSEESKLIDSYIKEGKIVPVRITCKLLKKAMIKHGWNVNASNKSRQKVFLLTDSHAI